MSCSGTAARPGGVPPSRRLPASALPDEAEHLAPPDVEGDPVEGAHEPRLLPRERAEESDPDGEPDLEIGDREDLLQPLPSPAPAGDRRRGGPGSSRRARGPPWGSPRRRRSSAGGTGTPTGDRGGSAAGPGSTAGGPGGPRSAGGRGGSLWRRRAGVI